FSSCCRIILSHPTCWPYRTVTISAPAMMSSTGTIHLGRLAISWKAFDGSKKTPVRRESSLMPAGSGSTAVRFSGVISSRLYSSHSVDFRLWWRVHAPPRRRRPPVVGSHRLQAIRGEPLASHYRSDYD